MNDIQVGGKTKGNSARGGIVRECLVAVSMRRRGERKSAFADTLMSEKVAGRDGPCACPDRYQMNISAR